MSPASPPRLALVSTAGLGLALAAGCVIRTTCPPPGPPPGPPAAVAIDEPAPALAPSPARVEPAAPALRLRADAEVTVRRSEIRGLVVTEASARFDDAGGNRWFDAEGRRLDAPPWCPPGVACDHLGPVR